MSPNAWRNRPLPPRAGEGRDGGERFGRGAKEHVLEGSALDDFIPGLTVRPHPTLPRLRGRALIQLARDLPLPPRAGEGRDGGERSGRGAKERVLEGSALDDVIPGLTVRLHPTLPRLRGRALIQRARSLPLPPRAGEGWDGGERSGRGAKERVLEGSALDDVIPGLTVCPHPTLPRLRGRALASGATGVCRVTRTHAATPAASPANSVSSACTSSGAKRHTRTPGASSRLASSPRQNRYRAPPKSRA